MDVKYIVTHWWWFGKAETYVGALDYTCGNTVHLSVF
jgi:ammonia channel protein AmtB